MMSNSSSQRFTRDHEEKYADTTVTTSRVLCSETIVSSDVFILQYNIANHKNVNVDIFCLIDATRVTIQTELNQTFSSKSKTSTSYVKPHH